MAAMSNVSQSIKSVARNPHISVNIIVNHPVDYERLCQFIVGNL
jgi:hypothetical protein